MPKTISLATSYGNNSKSNCKAKEVIIKLVVENCDFQISNLKSQISKKVLSQNSLYHAVCLRLFIFVFHCHHYTAIPILFFRKKTIDDSRTRLAAPTVEVLECMKSWMKGGYYAETPEIQGVAELFVRTQ